MSEARSQDASKFRTSILPLCSLSLTHPKAAKTRARFQVLLVSDARTEQLKFESFWNTQRRPREDPLDPRFDLQSIVKQGILTCASALKATAAMTPLRELHRTWKAFRLPETVVELCPVSRRDLRWALYLVAVGARAVTL